MLDLVAGLHGLRIESDARCVVIRLISSLTGWTFDASRELALEQAKALLSGAARCGLPEAMDSANRFSPCWSNPAG